MSQDLAALGIIIDTTGVRKADSDLDQLTKTGKRVENAADQISAAFGRMARQLAGTFAGLFALHEITAFIKEITLLNSRYEEMGIVMNTVGSNMGRNRSELAAYEEQLRKTGISALEARTNITKMMQADIDLANASKLARLAQDAAVIGNMNSSQAFATLIHGIQSAQVEVLRNIGITVNWEQAYKKFAGQIGKTAKDLSEYERMQARLNAVMEQGPAIAGVYENAMTNSGKMLRTLSRYAEDLKIELGKAFSSAFDTLVGAMGTALKGASVHADTLARAMAALTAATATYLALIAAGEIPNALVKIGAAMKALAVMVMANPLIGVAAVIAGIVAAYVMYKDKLVELGGHFAKVADYVQATWETASDAFTKGLAAIDERMGGFFSYMGDRFKELPDAFIDAGRLLVEVVTVTIDHVVGMFLGMHNALTALFTSTGKAIAATFDNISKLVQGFGAGLKQVFESGFTDFSFKAFRDQISKNVDGSAETIAKTTVEAFKRGYGTKTVEQATAAVKDFWNQIGKRADELQRAQARRDMLNNYGDLTPKARTRPTDNTKDDEDANKMIENYEKIIAEIKKKNAETLLEIETAGKLSAGQKYALDIMEKLRSGELALDTARKRALATLLETYLANEKLLQQKQEALKMSDDLMKAGDTELQQQADKLKKAQEEGEQIGLTAIQLAELTRQRELESAAAKEELAFNMLAAAEYAGDLSDAYKAYAKSLLEAADAQRKLADQEFSNAQAKAAVEAAKQAQQEWQRAADSIERTITDSLMRAFDSGKGFVQSLVQTIKNLFARLILQPIVAPIAAGIADMMVPGAAGGAGVGGIGVGGGGASKGIFGASTDIVGAGKMLWDGFSKGFMALPLSVGSALARVGATLGFEGLRQFGSGMTAAGNLGAGATAMESAGSMFGAALPWASGGLMGMSIGNMLSGNLSVLGSPQASTAIGTAIGAAVAGPLGAAVGGALSGLVNRLFGMGEKQITGVGIAGSFNYTQSGGSSSSANDIARYHQDGGLFRGDRNGTDVLGADGQMASAVKETLDAMIKKTNELSQTINKSGAVIDWFNADFNVTIAKTGDAAKDAAALQEALKKRMDELGDAMATIVIPNIMQFAKQGETAGQVLVRLAATFSATNRLLDIVGKSSEQAFGAVGLASASARQNLVDLAGGIDQFNALMQSFEQGYLSSEERLALARKDLQEATDAAGLGAINSRDQIKEMVMAQSLSTQKDRERMVELLKLAQSYDTIKKMETQLAQETRAAAAATARLAAALSAVGISGDKAIGALKDAGGEGFTDNLLTYIREFNSEADAAAAEMIAVNGQLMSLGLGAAATKDQFKGMVESVAAAVQSGTPGAADLYAQLINLAPAFAQAANAAQQAVDSTAAAVRSAEDAVRRAAKGVDDAWQRVNDAQKRIGEVNASWQRQQEDFARRAADMELQERRRQEDKLREVMMEGMQKTLDGLRALQDEADQQLQRARSQLSTAYSQQADSLKTLIDRFRQFAAAMRSFRESLLTSDLSPLTPVQQYQEASSRVDSLYGKAMSGDVDAQGQFQAAVNDWLSKSKTLYSSSTRYQQDFLKAQQLLQDLSVNADSQASSSQSQLDALNKLIEEIMPDLIQKTVDVTTAINDLKAAQAAADEARLKVEAQQAEIEAAQREAQMVEEFRHQEDLAAAQMDLQRQIADAYLAYQQSLIDAERGVQDAVEAAHEAEMELMSAQDTLAAAQSRHAEALAAMERIRAAIENSQEINSATFQRGFAELMKSQDWQTAQSHNDLWAMNNMLATYAQQQMTMIMQLQIADAQKQALENQLITQYTLLYNQVNGSHIPLPGHADGLDYVPYDNYVARLHKGERVLTADEARLMDYGSFGKGGAVALVAEIRALRAEVSRLREDNAQQATMLAEAGMRAADYGARKIADSNQNLARESSWRDRSQPKLR